MKKASNTAANGFEIVNLDYWTPGTLIAHVEDSDISEAPGVGLGFWGYPFPTSNINGTAHPDSIYDAGCVELAGNPNFAIGATCESEGFTSRGGNRLVGNAPGWSLGLEILATGPLDLVNPENRINAVAQNNWWGTSAGLGPDGGLADDECQLILFNNLSWLTDRPCMVGWGIDLGEGTVDRTVSATLNGRFPLQVETLTEQAKAAIDAA